MYLNTHTYFSLRYGTFSPENLLELASSNGASALVLTDINTTSACLEFNRIAPKFTIRPIVGIDFRKGVQQYYVAIAKNNEGFKNLNAHLTAVLHGDTELECTAPHFENAFIVYPFEKNKVWELKANEYVGISPRDLDYIRLKKMDTSKYVMLQTVTFRNKRDFNAHRLLRAIDNNTLLSKLPPSEQARDHDKIIVLAELIAAFEDFPAVIKNTQYIIDSSEIDFDFSENAEPKTKKHIPEPPRET